MIHRENEMFFQEGAQREENLLCSSRQSFTVKVIKYKDGLHAWAVISYDSGTLEH